MIYVHFPEENPQVKSWLERLDELIVGYQTACDPALEQPVVFENQQRFSGEAAIEKFLKELEDDIADWRTPRCGV